MSILYERNGDIIEITVRDSTRKKIGTWKMNVCDKKLCSGVFRYLEKQYGFTPSIKPEEQAPSKQEEFWK